MQTFRLANLQRILLLLAVVLILKVTFSVVLGYRNYFPPNFDNDFLSGRQAYFAALISGRFMRILFPGLCR